MLPNKQRVNPPPLQPEAGDSDPCRVSVVSFLNALPLTFGLDHFEGRFLIHRDTPARCAERLAAGDADVGLVPSIAYQEIPGLTILPDLAIAADGLVQSVLLLSRHRRLSSVKTLALDPASRTSATLSRILFQERYGTNPEATVVAGDPRKLALRYDAVLVIGDRALRARDTDLRCHDLAALWKRTTGLPFVFAFWAVRKGARLGKKRDLFPLSLALGIGHLDKIIDKASIKVDLTRQELETYFTRRLNYRLGPREKKGLELFYDLARRHRLIPRRRKLRFHRDGV